MAMVGQPRVSGDFDQVVSFDDEPLILVDADDRVLGYDTKAACHAGDGRMHRAFSVFLFNQRRELLLHQRSADKPLWPLFWTNTCCSHPRRGETLEEAAHRRLREELGLTAELRILYKFAYQARFAEIGSENELCAVLVGRCDATPRPNPNEIVAWRYVTREQLDVEMAREPERYTPWFKMEWARLCADYGAAIAALGAGVRP